MGKDYSDRKIVKQYIDRDYYFEGDLTRMVEELQEILDNYPTSIIKVDYDSIDAEYDIGYRHVIFIERLENDVEYEARIKRDTEAAARREAADKEEYERLKKRYGDS